MYDLTDVLDVAAIETVSEGTSILVSGPAMTGTEALTREILADGARDGQGAVVVTTSATAAEAIDDLTDRVPSVRPEHLTAIDCRGEDSHGQEEGEDGSFRYHVSDPSDLTGMGIGITQSFERLADAGVAQSRLGLSSLSTMLTYTDQQTVFKFCHVLTSRIDTAGHLGAFTIDSSAHDAQALQVVKQPFDGMIEIREREGAREARVLGLQPDPSPWIEL